MTRHVFSHGMVLAALLASPAITHASNVGAMTFLPVAPAPSSLPGSAVLGFLLPTDTQGTVQCGGNSMPVGLQVNHDGQLVTGLRLLCRFAGVVGAINDDIASDSAFVGRAGSASRIIRCDSGEAIHGLVVRSGFSLDAITIVCRELAVSNSVVNYANDPTFGSGQGAQVFATGGAAHTMGSPIGGPGGTLQQFTCTSGTKTYVHMLQIGFDSQHVNAVQARCNRVLTKVIDQSATLPDLVVRTLNQQRIRTITSGDTFVVEVFNLGAPIPASQSVLLYFELVFSSTLIEFVPPAGCTFPSSNRIRCPLTNSATFARGSSLRLSRSYRFLSPPPGPAPFVVSATYDLDESTHSNNSYGFPVMNP